MKFGIIISSQQKGFFASIGQQLIARGHDVVFFAQDHNVVNSIQSVIPDIESNSIDVRDDYVSSIPNDIIESSREREVRYNETFAMIASYDRALGKGYLYNADGHPDVVRGWFDKQLKYGEILKDFLYWEYAFDRYAPQVILSIFIPKVTMLVAREYRARCFGLSGGRYESLYYWAENEYDQNLKMIKRMEDLVDYLSADCIDSNISLKRPKHALYHLSFVRYSLLNAVLEASKLTLKETAQMLKGSHKSQTKAGYKYLAWNAYLLRIPRIYKYLKKHGISPEKLITCKYVLFPLQTEPEVSLMSLSPEFNSSLEIISWVSKSLPADYLLVVKEHPGGFGARKKTFYDNLLRMPNVTIADPDASSIKWLEGARCVVVITGTMGVEAVYSKKPVLSFGMHQPINSLPTVEFADSFSSTRKALTKLLALEADDPSFIVSREAYHRAQLEVSTDLDGLEKTFESEDSLPTLAKAALDNLIRVYPEILS